MNLTGIRPYSPRRFWRDSAHNRAVRSFSLLEILVAVAVLSLLVVMVTKLVEGGNLVITGSRKHLNADGQAREVFSRFEADLRRMPMRSDMDVVLSSNNDALFFLSESSGFFTSADTSNQSTLTLVGYRVNNQSQLERLGKGLSWTNLPFLTYATNAPASNSTAISASTLGGAWGGIIGTPPTYSNGTDSDYRVFADGVFRLFYCFQKKDGTYTLTLVPDALKGRFHQVSGIVLTLAVLDAESRKMVNDFSKLASALPTPEQTDLNNNILPGQLWKSSVDNTPNFASAAGIPPAAAAQVKIYQRTFPITTP